MGTRKNSRAINAETAPPKKYRGRKPGSKNKPKLTTVAPSAPQCTTVVQADSVPRAQNPLLEALEIQEERPSGPDRLRSLDEHNPFLQVLAEEWEVLDAQIVALKERQEFIQSLVNKCRERVGAI